MNSKTYFALVSVVFAFELAAHAAVEVAKVNGRTITDTDMQLALGSFNDGQRKSILDNPAQRRSVLDTLIDREVLSEQAEKQKLDQEGDFKKAYEAWKKDFLSTRLLEKNLASKITTSTAKKYFELNRSRYNTDQVHVLHVLLNDEDTAREVMQKAKAPNVDFQELAEKYSKDPSAKNNRGDIGYVSHDAPFVAEFKEAAFNAGKNEVVGPVHTAYGYHVIKVVDKRLGTSLNFDEVELRVKTDMRQEMVQNFVRGLKKNAKIVINEKALDKL